MFAEWEATLALPLQSLVSIMAVIPKPQGGERLVALMHRLFRIYFRSRRSIISDWEAAQELWWDTALAGSSALKAALLRAFGVDCSTLSGASIAAAFVDIAKFYDSLDPVLLMRRLIDMGFPAAPLALHLQANWA